MAPSEAGKDPPAKAGRRRDHARDAVILDAALEVLAETGYEGMTIDLVAARAGMARATVYRRWASKTDLVLAAAARLSATDADPDRLPDTGSYRDDAIAAFVPDGAGDQRLRLQVVSGLLAVARTDPRFAEAATLAGIEPWIELNRRLMRRAVDRGEFPPGDIDTLAQVIPLLCLSRALQQKPITAEFSRTLLDGVIIPALRAGSRPAQDRPGPHR
ncbi:TetR/AcrR family transcriptional regulator [Amycolatopsis sp. PS_44_ISF1]|uniref:TetR/AcrR family transcriptional regulator n=1 Tax=Amycolatopsis sp. PS_44_ISF1 TaxID=2974917 RepID=UPI0028DF0B81|nr:TetR/AcrR family transcriptional regulator [Amycolatopsis sp. PS_44_ISF1]MDT8911976.1 TetR/AcrR family transcriptional regulator [Amycolatopsis sp. PS_44_ISF1]